MFCNKGVLKILTKFTGKHLCQCLFLNEVTSLRPATLLKKLWHRCFPVNFAKFLRPVFYRTPPLVVSDLQSEGVLVTRDVFGKYFESNIFNCNCTKKELKKEATSVCFCRFFILKNWNFFLVFL